MSRSGKNTTGDGGLGLAGAWSMGVGGMIGGGIFSTLGVVISVAGKWAWLSFLIGGLIALASGYCMAALTVWSGKAGGIYRYLHHVGYPVVAKISAWVLILGYTLTVAVYASTFGYYLANAVGGPAWLPQAMAVTVILAFAAINLRGVGDAAGVEIAIVTLKLLFLTGLAVLGLARFDAARLATSHAPGWFGAIVGAASVFMAYEGFELLAYDYEEMVDRRKLIGRSISLSILTALIVYIAVTLATPMLAAMPTIIKDGDVALAKAGEAILGTPGLLAMTAAAALSTGSAINATLFSTARLAREVASEDELPAPFASTNSVGSPYVGVIVISSAALLLAVIGGLAGLVTAASVVFLLVFGTVNLLAWIEGVASRLVAGFGTIGAFLAMALLLLHLVGQV